jgi:hypothetical protein
MAETKEEKEKQTLVILNRAPSESDQNKIAIKKQIEQVLHKINQVFEKKDESEFPAWIAPKLQTCLSYLARVMFAMWVGGLNKLDDVSKLPKPNQVAFVVYMGWTDMYQHLLSLLQEQRCGRPVRYVTSLQLMDALHAMDLKMYETHFKAAAVEGHGVMSVLLLLPRYAATSHPDSFVSMVVSCLHNTETKPCELNLPVQQVDVSLDFEKLAVELSG